jgi:hypothetical protein
MNQCMYDLRVRGVTLRRWPRGRCPTRPSGRRPRETQGVWKPKRKQTQDNNIGLKCLQGGRAHPTAACAVATLCCSLPTLLVTEPRAVAGCPLCSLERHDRRTWHWSTWRQAQRGAVPPLPTFGGAGRLPRVCCTTGTPAAARTSAAAPAARAPQRRPGSSLHTGWGGVITHERGIDLSYTMGGVLSTAAGACHPNAATRSQKGGGGAPATRSASPLERQPWRTLLLGVYDMISPAEMVCGGLDYPQALWGTRSPRSTR